MLLAMEYLPYDQRPASTQYRRVLAHILGTGIETETRQGVNALTAMQQTMTFRLAEGFPVITERSIRSFWRKPIGELCAFINGATTLKEFEAFGVDWWGPWATPESTPGDPLKEATELSDMPRLSGNQFISETCRTRAQ